ncbi:DUF6894 family protein [Bradyrhizobium sp. RDM4]|uniref:DUF6894 family protein n=1 Tax=Bradyrhizobium sp. RDM4 TaxID=3378765 RepID=UPI0038FD18D7
MKPRSYFNVTHEHTEIDRVGEKLSDKQAAWKEATVMAGQTLQALAESWGLVGNGGWKFQTNSETVSSSCTSTPKSLSNGR